MRIEYITERCLKWLFGVGVVFAPFRFGQELYRGSTTEEAAIAAGMVIFTVFLLIWVLDVFFEAFKNELEVV